MALDAGIGANSASGGYDIDNSCKFEADNREYLRWNNISSYASSTRKKTFSFSAWVKLTEVGSQCMIWSTASNGYLTIQASGVIKWQQTYGGVQKTLNTNRVFRDTSAWYNIIIAVDSTQSTEANRSRLYVNGVEETSFSSATYPSQNAEAQNVYEQHHYIGEWGGGQSGWCGYIANPTFISDAQITPSDVGEFDSDTGIWKPKEYTGTISSPSYFLEFKDSSDLGNATSGLNVSTLNNIAAADQSTDTPTNNFCTMNQNSRTNGNIKTQEGGTKVTTDGGAGWVSMNATMGVQAGKWYWEILFYNDPGDTNTVMIGIAASDDPWIPHASGGYYLGNVATGGSIGWYFVNGGIYNGSGTWTGPGYGNIAMVALDCDNGKLYFGVNGTWQNSSNPATNSNGINYVSQMSGSDRPGDFILPSVSVYQGNRIQGINFGGYYTETLSSASQDANGYGNFEYAPPSGFYALCTKNLAEYG